MFPSLFSRRMTGRELPCLSAASRHTLPRGIRGSSDWEVKKICMM